MIDLVIFDCDGVLVDSEAISCRVHSDMLTRHGYPITSDQVHERFLGRSSREARLEIETELGRALPDAYGVEMKAEMTRVFGESLQPMAHVRGTLAAITQPVCVASSGTPERIRLSLGIAGLLDCFGANIFSAAQAVRGKPAPDLFLYAAAQMGAKPARSLVIEDSSPGVIGAIAANMMVLGFCGGAHCKPDHAAALRAAGAAATFEDMSQLPDLIAEYVAIRERARIPAIG